jgi:hypothetical protein
MAEAAAAPETIDVDIHGVKVPLPPAEAKRVIANRDAEKATLRELHEQMGRIKAEKDAVEAARAKAEQDAKALEHAKKGEIDQVREIVTKEHREKLSRVEAHLRDKALRAAVASAPKVVPTAIDDIVDQLKARSRYDADADAVVVTDASGQTLKDNSGKPVAVDAYIGEWLGSRPHYLLSGVVAGSGAQGGAKSAGAKVITAEQMTGMSPREVAAHFAAGGTLAP